MRRRFSHYDDDIKMQLINHLQIAFYKYPLPHQCLGNISEDLRSQTHIFEVVQEIPRGKNTDFA